MQDPTRERILDAAETLFAEHGFANTSLRAITARANYADVLGRFESALMRALPHLPKDELDWRVHFLLGSVSYTLAVTDTMKIVAERELPDADDKKVLLRRLVRFLAGGLSSPLPGHMTRR